MSKDNHELSRREFIRQSACAALELTGLVNTMGFLRLTNASVLQGNLALNGDYKALVCIYLSGGNDAHNMLVPMGDPADNPIRADYEAARSHVQIPSSDLHPLTIPADSQAFKQHYGDGTFPMGIHPSAPQLAELFNNKDLAFMCNVGSLAFPIVDRQSYLDKKVQLPPNLFAHDKQQMQWQTSMAEKNGTVGWGGRLADLLHAGYNGDASKASMSISLDGVSTFQRGLLPETAAFTVSPTGVRSLKGFGTNYASAVEIGNTFESPLYKNTSEGHRLKMLEGLMRLSSENLLENEVAQRFRSSRMVEGAVGESLTSAGASGVNFDQIFASADNRLGDQLKIIAKLITGQTAIGNRRQIFFARVNGYDNHNSLLESHAPLMDELGSALKAFRDALVAAGQWDNVVTFTASDFARTLIPNTNGTDHAWGSHAIVMGGPVNGGDFHGHYPSLKLGDHPESLDADARGLIIPTTAVDQFSAPMAHWFGADSSAIETIFPNLARFDDPLTSSAANLKFIS
ncbi:MAG: DUF1501 domain-containing protein [Chloroflexota bacterium]